MDRQRGLTQKFSWNKDMCSGYYSNVDFEGNQFNELMLSLKLALGWLAQCGGPL